MPKYTVKQSSTHGVGLFADHDIPAGDIIILEPPLLDPPLDISEGAAKAKLLFDVHQLSDRAFNTLRGLCHTIQPEHVAELTKANVLQKPDIVTLLLIDIVLKIGLEVDTASGERRIVFDDLARVTHACRPNAQLSWVEEKRLMALKATKGIRKGEEICRTYLSGRWVPFLVKSERAEALREVDIVNCKCETCVLIDEDEDEGKGPSLTKIVQKSLKLFASFREQIFGQECSSDLFADIVGTSDRVIAIREARDDVRKGLEWSLPVLKRAMADLGLAHSSLALVYEIEHLLLSADALYDAAKHPRSVVIEGNTNLDARFRPAMRAKLEQVRMLITCLGMWHSRTQTVLQEAIAMANTLGNEAVACDVVEGLMNKITFGEGEFQADGFWDLTYDALADVKRFLKQADESGG